MPLEHGTRLGPYAVIELIGTGGMGEVYRASDTVLGRDVALKVLPASLALDPDRLARLRREAQVLASLNHPNIAQIYGCETAPPTHQYPGGVQALVLELVDGPTLADRIGVGPIDLTELLAVARQIAAAVGAAHDAGIIHRDLKPANIKVRSDGTVKVLDFGLAKAVDVAASGLSNTSDASVTVAASERHGHKTSHGLIVGTASYMSPEQARGRPIDSRTDIWAFGVIVAEMATGQRLFDGETISDTIAAVLTRDPDLTRVPRPLLRLVRACLARDPRDRLRHVADAMALVDEPSLETAAIRVTRVPVWAFAAALAAVCLFAAGGGWLALRPRPAALVPTTFYIDAPFGTAFNYTYTATAVSPDGRQVVFRVGTATEAPALWLRPLDALTGSRLAGTDGADFPFWSPDGRALAFFAGGKLKRVDVAGGTPIVLADAADDDAVTSGGSWNDNGVIIFGSPEGMYRVSASGGTPALIAPINRTLKETGYGAPQFLPDGDRFLMFLRSEDAAREGLYLTSLSQPARKTLLLQTRRKAIFAANEGGTSGYILYLQDRTLLARPISRETLAWSGEPVAVASNIALFPPGFHASFYSSRSGHLLVYRTEASDKPRLSWILPDGKRQVVTGTDDFYTHVRVSADGSRVAIELADANGNLDVWTRDFARGIKTRQTFDPKPDRAPTWAPNGHDLAFSSVRTGTWQIYRKNADSGQQEEQLTSGPRDKILPEWSRDSRFLLFIQIGTTTAEDIWAMPLNGDRQPYPVLATTANDTNPALSPDGHWLAYESSQSGRPEIFVTPFPESGTVANASSPKWQVSLQGGSRPRWAGDGHGLFYISLDDLRIFRAEVRTTPAGFESSAPRVYAEIPVMPVARAPFDVTRDNRLLLLERTISHSVPLVVEMNWLARLDR
jgi:Tol biopolymer transport system component/tRNA A-37 threonylcarbamoyl transferase component Bud32